MTGTIGILLIIINVIFSYQGFRNHLFFDRYKFEIDSILVKKDYKRLITSGFLHVGWTHLIFNMISLLLFSGIVESYLGSIPFLVIYFASLIGGDLLSLLIHRHHSDYSAVGASGAVCGVIFASIALFPGLGVSFFGLPLSIPGWLYGIVFVLFSIYGIKSGKDNIGHDAHLGGGLIGLLTALCIRPQAFAENYTTILIIAVPAIIFIYLIISRPHFLLVDNHFFKAQRNFYSIDHRYNAEKKFKQAEVDRILEKIHKTGMNSLNKKEKETLDQYSRTNR